MSAKSNDPYLECLARRMVQEEEAACAQAAMAGMPQAPVAAVSAADIIKPWAMSGRQAQMQMRTLMQMRTFHRNGSF